MMSSDEAHDTSGHPERNVVPEETDADTRWHEMQATSATTDDISKSLPERAADQAVLRTAVVSDAERINVARQRSRGMEIGQSVRLKYRKYTVLDVISASGQSSEATVYKVRRDDESVLALKLYQPLPHNEEPNPDALSRILSISDPDILRLHDYGVGADKLNGVRCFEIADFAEGGTLLSKGDYDPEIVEQIVVPQMLKGIKCLHRHRICHCDLKPENVFYKDESKVDLVIGDYGSAKTFDQDSNIDIKHTMVVKGTSFYQAPEQYYNIISTANDYFSFGMILLRLLYPEETKDQLCHQRIRTRNALYKKIIEFSQQPQYQRLNRLIEGLTLLRVEHRWQGETVEAWLAKESPPVIYGLPQNVGVELRLGKNCVITTLNELHDYIEQSGANGEWHGRLIADREGYAAVLSLIMSAEDQDRKNEFDKLVTFFREVGRPFLYQSVLRFFEPSRLVCVDATVYDLWGANNLSGEVERFFGQLDDMWRATKLPQLQLYVCELEHCLLLLSKRADHPSASSAIELLGRLRRVAGATLESTGSLLPSAFRQITNKLCLNLFYEFSSNRSFRGHNGTTLTSLVAIGEYYSQFPDQYTDEYSVLERTSFAARNGLEQLAKLNLFEFLSESLAESVRAEVILEDIQLSHAGSDAILTYTINRSLLEYFRENGIESKHQQSHSMHDSRKGQLTFKGSSTDDIVAAIRVNERLQSADFDKVALVKFKSDTASRLRARRIEMRRQKMGAAINFVDPVGVLLMIFMLLPAIIGLVMSYALHTGYLPVIDGINRLIAIGLTAIPLQQSGPVLWWKFNLLLFISIVPSLVIFYAAQGSRVLSTDQKQQVRTAMVAQLSMLAIGPVAFVLIFVALWLVLNALASPIILFSSLRYADVGKFVDQSSNILYFLCLAAVIGNYIYRFWQLFEDRLRPQQFLIAVGLMLFIGQIVANSGSATAQKTVQPPAPPQPIFQVVGTGTMTVNLRTGPSTSTTHLRKLSVTKEKRYPVYESVPGWYRIVDEYGSPKLGGWVASNLFTVVSQEIEPPVQKSPVKAQSDRQPTAVVDKNAGQVKSIDSTGTSAVDGALSLKPDSATHRALWETLEKLKREKSAQLRDSIITFQSLVSAENAETNTGQMVLPGDEIEIQSSGHISCDESSDEVIGPAGSPISGGQGATIVPLVPGAPTACLLGRIGDGAWFPLGASFTETCRRQGELTLCINEAKQYQSDNTGAFRASITIKRKIAVEQN